MSIEKIANTKKDDLFEEEMLKDKHMLSEGAESKDKQHVTYE